MQLGHLIEHYSVVGGDKEVVKEALILRKKLLAPLGCLERAMNVPASGM